MLARDRAKTDKLYLARAVLGYDFVPEVHGELFDQYIQINADTPLLLQSAIKNRMVLWPRGHFKTTSIVVEIVQLILNFPDIRILLMQGSLKTTKRLLKEIASHFTGDASNSRLMELFPEFCGDKKKLELTTEYFTTPARIKKQLQQATVSCASPKTTKTGQHYDAAFFDDLINDQNYRNPTLLQKAQDDFFMCTPLLDPGAYRYVTGTRYAFGDLYENIAKIALGTPGLWMVSIKTCWTDDGKEVRFPQRGLSDGRIIGFTRELLDQIKADDAAMFSSQYLNQPMSQGGQPFWKEMMLAACYAATDTPALTQPIFVIDLAGGKYKVADDCVIVVGRTDSYGRMYIEEVRGGVWSPLQLAESVIKAALQYRPLRILIEHTPSATYFFEYLRTVCRDHNIILPLDFIKVSSVKDAKHLRILSLAGLISQKKLFFSTKITRWEQLLEQFVHYPNARYNHDDYPDTVALFVQQVGQALLTMPLPNRMHPLLRAIEEQGSKVTNQIFEVNPHPEGQMGGDFTDF